MKKILLLLVTFTSLTAIAQQKAPNQKQRLAQYAGNWESADNITDDKPGKKPAIKMTVVPRMDGSCLQVEVFQKKDSAYQLLLVELISYDAVTDQVVAAGQNNQGQCFIGKGFFDTNNKWVMEDRNFKGELTLNVSFDFVSSTAVVLKGVIPGADGWQVKYIKVKSKKIEKH
jgi:hypothetical protein